jgi:hypothetical protein
MLLTHDQKMSKIKLSNYDIKLGYQQVNVKREGKFEYIQAYNLKMYENTYTIDGWLIGNRIE